jgi:NADH:ubiquinone oxidoreductase subunit F (NADH-binding)
VSRTSPFPIAQQVRIVPGTRLLSGAREEPTYLNHVHRWETWKPLDAYTLQRWSERVDLRGRGGAGFPFARKFQTVANQPGRKVVVANLAESEPASSKDFALAITAPHLIIDGLLQAAQALETKDVHIVVPIDRPQVGKSMRAALAERRDARSVEVTAGRVGFLSGQARAMVEMLSGHEALPITAREPEAVDGVRGLPTLLSNAETWAQLAVLARLAPEEFHSVGTQFEPGTTLLTLREDDGKGISRVMEVDLGVPFETIVPAHWGFSNVLVGGFHGGWIPGPTLLQTRCSPMGLRLAKAPFGAGVLLSTRRCPIEVTAEVLDYLAGQNAGRCGPCRNGMPALATAMQALASRRPAATDCLVLSDLIKGRGACAHPDGSARLAQSVLTHFSDHVSAHERGQCSWHALPAEAMA